MKVTFKGNPENTTKIKIETNDIYFEITQCFATGNIIINKTSVNKTSSLSVLPRYSNEIEIN